MSGLGPLLQRGNMLVCCGSGGVGKTTIAASLAVAGARAGLRACVVTIDPARRLADALGLETLPNVAHRVPLDLSDGLPSGELWALMLDPKSTFDALVERYAESPDQAQRILDNRLYRNISGALSGTQEYMAAEKLYELAEEGRFDLLVVDTPPSRNALDFLEAPARLTRFLDNRLFRLVVAPARSYLKAVSMAAQAFVRTVAKVVGAEVVDDAVAFFQAFEGMEEGFRDRAERVDRLLGGDGTAFVLVASARKDTVAEAIYFTDRLVEMGKSPQALVANRLHPRFGRDGSESLTDLAASDRARADSLGEDTPLGALYANLAEFRQVAEREDEVLATLVEKVSPAPVCRVPYLEGDVSDLQSLERVAQILTA
ncbi:MAG: ArsA family ATPase [Actinobacteria bacterium]|nr:ArsA family ATPase [Actinomycetota bacterium]